MINVEDEVKKYVNSKDRNELERMINEYKSLALQHAANLSLAGQYNQVAQKLQEICDRLPAPKLARHSAGSAQSGPAKTASITSEEQARIDADWKKKTKK